MRHWTHARAPGHEGGLIGLVKRQEGPWRFGDDYRELTAADRDLADYPPAVQVGCSCGWRSPRMVSPIGVCWRAGRLDAPEYLVADCESAWRVHARAEMARLESAAAMDLALDRLRLEE